MNTRASWRQTRRNQGFPQSGSPAQLEPNKTYYIYASADVMVPITRCLFTFTGK